MLNTKGAGIAACILLSLCATWLASVQSVVGGPMVGLLLGMLVMNVVPLSGQFLSGTKLCSKKFLTWGIVIAGATLNLEQILGVGGRALPLLICNIGISFGVAYLVGRYLNVSWNTSMLVGGGTAICGGTAIATVASVIKAKEAEIAYAMTAIFLFDMMGAMVFPYVATALGLSEAQFGFLAGAAINDTSSVTAAEATYNVLHGLDMNMAITVKLARTTLLIFVAMAFAFLMLYRNTKSNTKNNTESVWRTVLRTFPWFILVFAGMAVLNTMGVFSGVSTALGLAPTALGKLFKTGFKFLTTVALCGVGFKMRFRDLLVSGRKPILLGGAAWLSVTATTFAFVLLLADYING